MKRLPFLRCRFLPLLSWITWPIHIHHGAIYSVPLIYALAFLSIPYCFDYCSFVVKCETRDHTLTLVFFLKIVLASQGLLYFHTNFRIICSSSVKMPTPGVGDGQGGLACSDSWGCKELDTTEWLIWSDLIVQWILRTFLSCKTKTYSTPFQFFKYG